MTAHNILERAAQHMRDRATTYDKPEGERSMSATVTAFQAVTGHQITEEQGWLFMALLKAVRSQQGNYRADSYEDGAAYFALAGEAACNERNGGWSPDEIDAAAFKSEPDWPTDDRIDAIGQNGNDGTIYEYRDLDKPETWQAGDIVTGSDGGFGILVDIERDRVNVCDSDGSNPGFVYMNEIQQVKAQ